MTGVVINADLSNIIGSVADERYLNDFVLMSKRGLFAFDKTVTNHFHNPMYHLVAKPLVTLNFNQIPDSIMNFSEVKIQWKHGYV